MRIAKFVLRSMGLVLSVLLYSYLELIDLAPTTRSAPHPPSIITSNVRMLPLVVGSVAAVVLILGNGIRNAAYFAFVSLLVLAAMRSPAAEDSTHVTRYCMAGFIAASLIVWSSPGVMWLNPSDDDKVKFQTYEPQIRQLMLKYNPSELHLVDKWLSGEWKGRGKELLEHVRTQYTAAKQPKEATVNPTTTAASHMAQTPTGASWEADTVISGGSSYPSPDSRTTATDSSTITGTRKSPTEGSESTPSPSSVRPAMVRGTYGVREGEAEDVVDAAEAQMQEDVRGESGAPCSRAPGTERAETVISRTDSNPPTATHQRTCAPYTSQT